MLAAGVYDLGLTAAEFSSFTPRHVDAFYQRHLAHEERQERRTAFLATIILNSQGAKKSDGDRFTIEDFVPETRLRVRVVETHSDETPEETMQRMIGPQEAPELVVERIKALSHGFGKWSVENA